MMQKSVLCLFCFYDKAGIVDKYVEYLLNSLKNVSSRIVIAANGQLNITGKKDLLKYADELYVRDNTGYDAGAYKFLLEQIGKKELLKYDEIILCNDTFFGPFISFEEIHSKMDCIECDFWGLNGYFDCVFPHIQSYYLVFRRNIVSQELLYDYFEKYIDAKDTNLNDIYCKFETGLFDYLSRTKKMVYESYVNNANYDVYLSSYEYLKEYNLPIIKKKTFSAFDEAESNVWNSLKYIDENTDYDINLILESIKRNYNLHISQSDILLIDYVEIENKKVPQSFSTDKEIESFCSNSNFYIYGAGMYASKAYWRYGRNGNCKGFIVSEGQRTKKSLFNLEVYEVQEIADVDNEYILIGLGPEYTLEVYNNFKNQEHLMRIF